MALAVPLSRFTSRVGGGSAFFVRPLHIIMKIPPVLSGVAGEYFVAAELSRRGYIASISLRNTRGIDILATNQEASRSVTIQCNTRQKAGKSWMVSVKSEDFIPADHFYVFVALGADTHRPIYHIVPSCDVAAQLKKSAEHKQVKHQVRHFIDLDGKYKERWDLLGL